MGIPGIYERIGPPRRVSLAKLAAESFRENGRPLRIAVDFAIWEFQHQAARGGTNAAIRTLFYRLTRLLGTPVQPIFVFDGPHKPPFKRGKNSARGANATISQAQAKTLIRLFGFPVHDAPGEGEAECALLQKQGIVDAVMTEDVDALMFGSTCTIRNWAAEGKSQKTPTHVDVYKVDKQLGAINGYNRQGLVLVAMMSGGDYVPDGIKGCGVKVAGEAALAGFGKDLCRLKRSDAEGRKKWKESLLHELSTNESGYFRVKHRALSSVVTEEFPNMDVLSYYTRPAVSPVDALEHLKKEVNQEPDIRLGKLREYTREMFGWDYRIGAEKFVKVLGEALLARRMLYRPKESAIRQISKRREHTSADGEPELRVSYVPEELVPIDMSQERDEVIASSRDGLALNEDDEDEALEESTRTKSSIQPKPFDVTQPVFSWVLEEFARRTVPNLVTDWEESSRKPKAKSPRKKKGEMPRGAIDKFFSVTKKDGPKNTQKPARMEMPPTFSMPSSPLSSPNREPSKPPAPSRPNDGDDVSSLHKTPPRSKAANPREPIEITSSPIAPPTASPGRSRRQSTAFISSQISGTICSSFVSTQETSQGLKKKPVMTKAVKSKFVTKQRAQLSLTNKGLKYKQTVMDMFTTKSTSSQPIVSSQTVVGLDDPFDSSDEELPPLSSLTTVRASPARRVSPIRKMPDPASSGDEFHSFENSSPLAVQTQISPAVESPKSPGKRLKEPSDSEREPQDPRTPTKAGKCKKKLLVPRVSAVGYYKEVEVEESERDGLVREMEKTLGRGKVARVSDVPFIDLTQDD